MLTERVVILGALTLTCACSGARLPAAAAADARDADRPRRAELVEVARILAKNGDRVRAAQYLTLAQRQGVPARTVIPSLIALYTADAQYRLAIDAAESYLRRQPNDHRIRSCLGALYVAVDATSDAIRTYETLVQESPDDAEAHFALASLLNDASASRVRADAHYRSYLALAPAGRYAEEARAKLLKELP